MTDTFEFTLNNPLTEEQWDMIADVDFDHTDHIWFHTKHGKEVEFTKVRHGKWTRENNYGTWKCSECGCKVHRANPLKGNIWNYNYCPNCGARMDEDD